MEAILFIQGKLVFIGKMKKLQLLFQKIFSLTKRFTQPVVMDMMQ